MLSSITPLGERGRQRRWGITASSYLLGSALGGAALGSSLGLAGSLLPGFAPRTTALLLAALCLLTGAADLGLVPLPSPRRQVNEDWLDQYRGWVVGLGYGFQLGLGVVTIVTTGTLYLVAVLAWLSGSWAAGAAMGATFGLVRALPILALRRVSTPERLRHFHRRLHLLARPSRVWTVVALLVAALLLARPA
ncbi:MAG: DUF4407 domain-containing protein [Actinomycetota bacterium]|nr:DUF4407 domain-containing protein [Actinomycetota bacterium]